MNKKKLPADAISILQKTSKRFFIFFISKNKGVVCLVWQPFCKGKRTRRHPVTDAQKDREVEMPWLMCAGQMFPGWHTCLPSREAESEEANRWDESTAWPGQVCACVRSVWMIPDPAVCPKTLIQQQRLLQGCRPLTAHGNYYRSHCICFFCFLFLAECVLKLFLIRPHWFHSAVFDASSSSLFLPSAAAPGMLMLFGLSRAAAS